MYDYDPDVIEKQFAEAEQRAQLEKSMRRIPAPLFVIFDDVAGAAGIEKDKTKRKLQAR